MLSLQYTLKVSLLAFRTTYTPLSALIKLAIISVIAYLLYIQLSEGKGIEAIKALFQGNIRNLNLLYLIITIALMPLNWWLEGIKFKKLMSPHQQISYKGALSAVLAGIAAGIVTPGRIGEYAGRVFTSDPEHKTEVISATLLGSIAQNVCNIICGLLFSYFFLKSAIGVTYDNTYTFVVMITIQIVLLIGMYYHLPELAHKIEKIVGSRLTDKISSRLKSLDLYNNSLLNVVLGISVLRYIVYFSQYFCIMKFFGIGNSFLNLSGNISGIYMIQTGIPLPAFLSVMARGELAVLVWSGSGIDSMTALAATFSLWFINLIIPTAVGLIVLLRSDIEKYFK